MTWDKVYSLFPKATLKDKAFYILAPASRHLDRNVQCLLGAGFQFPKVDDLCADEEYWTQTRRIGDRYTWALDLDTTGVTPPVDTSPYIECTTFGFRRKAWRALSAAVLNYLPAAEANYWLSYHNTTYFGMQELEVIDSPIPRHKYTILFNCESELEALRTRLTALTLTEMEKIPEGSRPA